METSVGDRCRQVTCHGTRMRAWAGTLALSPPAGRVHAGCRRAGAGLLLGNSVSRKWGSRSSGCSPTTNTVIGAIARLAEARQTAAHILHHLLERASPLAARMVDGGVKPLSQRQWRFGAGDIPEQSADHGKRARPDSPPPVPTHQPAQLFTPSRASPCSAPEHVPRCKRANGSIRASSAFATSNTRFGPHGCSEQSGSTSYFLTLSYLM